MAEVEYFSDPPDKPNVSERDEHGDLTALIGYFTQLSMVLEVAGTPHEPNDAVQALP